jgi:hypothetical protein
MQHIYRFYNVAIPTIIDQIKVDLVKILGDCWRGKPSFPNVATATTIFTNVARETTMSQTWQERLICGKRGKRDDNMARATKTWQERRQRGNSDVIEQYGKKKLKFPLFFDSMARFVHNTANRTSKFLQYVLVSKEMTLKSDDQSSQKWHAKVCSSIAFLHKNGFGLENVQHKPSMNVLPWNQEGLVYIDLKLVTISQLPPKTWPKNGPNISQ